MSAEPQEVDPHALQRLRYTPGQDLLSRDLRDQEAFAAELRFWHNRAMHGAFGVRHGLGVSLDLAGAEPAVRVAAGLAYDAFGRELIQPAAARLAVPPGPPENVPRVLVVRWAAAGGRAGGCACGPVPHAAHAAHAAGTAGLAWLEARLLRPGDGVPLARVVYRGGAPALDLRFHPPAARPLARPHLGRGSTVAGATAWSPWSLDLFVLRDRRLLLPGLEIGIDTRAAGFTRRPCYFAWLEGAIPAKQAGEYLQSWRWIETDADATGFRFRLLFPLPVTDDDAGAATRAELLSKARRQLSVCWLGIQPQDGGAPSEVTDEHP